MAKNKEKKYLNWKENTGQIIIIMVLGVIKALISTIFQIAWGIASIFLLTGLIAYFKVNANSIITFLDIARFLMDHWGAAFVVIFLLEFRSIFKELELI